MRKREYIGSMRVDMLTDKYIELMKRNKILEAKHKKCMDIIMDLDTRIRSGESRRELLDAHRAVYGILVGEDK